MEERGEGGQREGGGTATEGGGGKEWGRRQGVGRQERRTRTCKRRELQEKGSGQNEVTLKQRLLEESRTIIIPMQEVAHDQHLSHSF